MFLAPKREKQKIIWSNLVNLPTCRSGTKTTKLYPEWNNKECKARNAVDKELINLNEKKCHLYRLKDEGDFFIECDRLINLSHWPKGPSSRNFSQFKCDHTISQCDTLLSNFTLKLAELAIFRLLFWHKRRHCKIQKPIV